MISSSIRSLSAAVRTGGIFDAIKDSRMDWLWEQNPRSGTWNVKEEALHALEQTFYRYLEDEGWPGPVKSWIYTMAIQGGAASFQWTEDSDVDVLVVPNLNKFFKLIESFTPAQWAKIHLPEQYQLVKQKGRCDGRAVLLKLRQCISGSGPWKNSGIRGKPNLTRITKAHPVDYHLVPGLHRKDLRFDNPPLLDPTNYSSYLAELPVERRRDEEGVSPKDTTWVREVKKLPTDFNLVRDLPELYQQGLGVLRYVTMPFDFLYEPDSPKDLVKAMEVLKKRFNDMLNSRNDGYKDRSLNPQGYTWEMKGETYDHPDVFAGNVGYKLIEKAGAKKIIKELISHKEYFDERYVRANFWQVRDEIRNKIEPAYRGALRLLKDSQGQYRYKNPGTVQQLAA